MDILDWIKERTIEYANLYDSGVSAEMRAGYRLKIAELSAIDAKIRELYGWQPGPPPAEPEDDSQWELESSDGSRALFTARESTYFMSDFLSGVTWDGEPETVRHRRIMPAPGEKE